MEREFIGKIKYIFAQLGQVIKTIEEDRLEMFAAIFGIKKTESEKDNQRKN